MRKRILFIFTAIFAFATFYKVDAATITCDYGKYVFKFNTNYYETKEYREEVIDLEGKMSILMDDLCPYDGIELEDSNHPCLSEVFKRLSEKVLSSSKDEYGLFQVYDKEKQKNVYPAITEEIGNNLPSSEKGCPAKIYERIYGGKSYFSSVSKAGVVGTYELQNSDIDFSNKVKCGNITGIPKKIPELTSYGFTIIQIAIPVILVIMGSIDLFKGITAQKEDEIKKGQQIFVKRLIVAALIFFVVVIVKLLVSAVAKSSSNDIAECIDCFISNDCN